MREAQAPRILIVDDDRAILLSYTMILERLGYSVSSAETSDTAKAQLHADRFDLLICDLSLEFGESGLDVIRAARRDDPSIAVILMTGYSDTELPPGFAGDHIEVVAKPANIPQLLETIKRLLDRGSAYRAAD